MVSDHESGVPQREHGLLTVDVPPGTGTTGDLARWLTSRRYAHTGGDVDRALDELDPSWHGRRRAKESAESSPIKGIDDDADASVGRVP